MRATWGKFGQHSIPLPHGELTSHWQCKDASSVSKADEAIFSVAHHLAEMLCQLHVWMPAYDPTIDTCMHAMTSAASFDEYNTVVILAVIVRLHKLILTILYTFHFDW